MTASCPGRVPLPTTLAEDPAAGKLPWGNLAGSCTKLLVPGSGSLAAAGVSAAASMRQLLLLAWRLPRDSGLDHPSHGRSSPLATPPLVPWMLLPFSDSGCTELAAAWPSLNCKYRASSGWPGTGMLVPGDS